ncbi:MAG: hypothetical protein EOP54_01415 [Sphingobacteriales bacterium]|nr:MAG: hypothetical protein EOP54_01415 [Sphingobacteriales bacterium]
MKKFGLALLLGILLAFTGHAATIWREVSPYSGGAGTSTVSICNFSACSAPIGVSAGSGFSTTATGVTTLTITFDYALYPGSPTTWTIPASSIGSSYTVFTIGMDQLYIRSTGRDSYSYFVRTMAL